MSVAQSMPTLPNICPLCPFSLASVVSYTAPNPIGCWEWGVGRSGERLGRVGT